VKQSNPEDGALRADTGPGIPSQDPSAMTWQALLRENFWLRELIESKLEKVEQRQDSNDMAVRLLQAFADRTPTTMDVQNKIEQLREVTEVKVDNINKAVDAAFAASKEVTGKIETSFTKQVDGLSAQTGTNLKAIDDKIGDMKDRITVIESKTSISDPTNAITLAKLDEKVSRLTSTTDISGGKSLGANWLWGVIAGILGLGFGLGTLLGVILKVFGK